RDSARAEGAVSSGAFFSSSRAATVPRMRSLRLTVLAAGSGLRFTPQKTRATTAPSPLPSGGVRTPPKMSCPPTHRAPAPTAGPPASAAVNTSAASAQPRLVGCPLSLPSRGDTAHQTTAQATSGRLPPRYQYQPAAGPNTGDSRMASASAAAWAGLDRAPSQP